MSANRIQFIEFNDEELFSEIKLDNHQAFEELYRRYFYRLLNDAYKRLHDRDQSEELVQELFVNLWSKRHQILLAKTFDAYFHTSLRNAVISFFRKNNKVAEYPADYTEQEAGQVTYEEITYNDLKTAYEQSVQELPEKCRHAYELFETGLSIQEIATETNVSPKTIESHLLKARNVIRQQLREYSLVCTSLFLTIFGQSLDLL
ncbi:RNA polymerase sigma-70 factor, ECF subfamily [Dyadobacter koreensis]|uniref:RNA polymerase sigma-70 factor, ECF subfamily n=1 Tax=Dyadobacter koreensis TaxID=408657 RepID=A0A1H7A8W7_9BACT|nr:sigma-70 family RNA polymerase sigma factor [Dyadobacter koreensis]SEJ62031.1 RNA polymerase sigma-70 factor, ECF subfamily [Dyadobacter koreensis]